MLGELDARGREQARALARAVCGEQPDQVALFEDPTETAAAIPVQPNRVRLERGRYFGDVWLGWMLGHALGLDEVFLGLLRTGHKPRRARGDVSLQDLTPNPMTPNPNHKPC